VAHLGVVGGDDLPRPAASAWARDLVVVDLELLADNLAQQPRRLGASSAAISSSSCSTARSAGSASLATSASSASRAALSCQSPSGFSRGRE
jgi:hypothetical protein